MVERRIEFMAVALFVGVAIAQHPARAEVLITREEAMLPAAPAVPLAFRGVTRAPKIEIVSPSANVKSPVKFQIKFQSFGGANVNPDSLRVTYMKNPAVDLTSRVKPYAQAGGIDMPTAELPPGSHDIRIDVKDNSGRAGSALFTLKVAQ